jgi:hypothetical protein
VAPRTRRDEPAALALRVARSSSKVSRLSTAESCPPEEFAERRAELARGYDHYFVHPEWVPELKRKYGLKMLGED